MRFGGPNNHGLRHESPVSQGGRCRVRRRRVILTFFRTDSSDSLAAKVNAVANRSFYARGFTRGDRSCCFAVSPFWRRSLPPRFQPRTPPDVAGRPRRCRTELAVHREGRDGLDAGAKVQLLPQRHLPRLDPQRGGCPRVRHRPDEAGGMDEMVAGRFAVGSILVQTAAPGDGLSQGRWFFRCPARQVKAAWRGRPTSRDRNICMRWRGPSAREELAANKDRLLKEATLPNNGGGPDTLSQLLLGRPRRVRTKREEESLHRHPFAAAGMAGTGRIVAGAGTVAGPEMGGREGDARGHDHVEPSGRQRG